MVSIVWMLLKYKNNTSVNGGNIHFRIDIYLVCKFLDLSEKETILSQLKSELYKKEEDIDRTNTGLLLPSSKHKINFINSILHF